MSPGQRESERKRIHRIIGGDIKAIRCGDQRLHVAQALHLLAGPAIDRLPIIAAKAVQQVVSFGPKHPDNRLGGSIRRGHDRRTSTTHRSAPGGTDKRRSRANLQDREARSSIRALRSGSLERH